MEEVGVGWGLGLGGGQWVAGGSKGRKCRRGWGRRVAERGGGGQGAGGQKPHRLEAQDSQWRRTEAALVFQTGGHDSRGGHTQTLQVSCHRRHCLRLRSLRSAAALIIAAGRKCVRVGDISAELLLILLPEGVVHVTWEDGHLKGSFIAIAGCTVGVLGPVLRPGVRYAVRPVSDYNERS